MTVVAGWEFVIVPTLVFGSLAEALKYGPRRIFVGHTGNEASGEFGCCVRRNMDCFLETVQAEIG